MGSIHIIRYKGKFYHYTGSIATPIMETVPGLKVIECVVGDRVTADFTPTLPDKAMKNIKAANSKYVMEWSPAKNKYVIVRK
jgi:carbonic anhydrase